MATFLEHTEALYDDAQKSQIWHQLERLKQSPYFAHSKRFPSFLSFIIQEELEGRGDQLKERTVGIEVFGREAGYDTTSDPIVRVTAAEIRKRIAQYYQEPGHEAELRISLPPGSYVPHLDWPQSPAAALNSLPDRLPTTLPHNVRHEAAAPHTVPLATSASRRFWPVTIAALTLLVFGFAGWRLSRPKPTSLDSFWAPLLDSGDPIVICFPRSHVDTITLRDARQPELLHTFTEETKALVLDDAEPLVSIGALIGMKHRPYILLDDAASLTDLRRGPTVFLGAFDNAWTLRITNDLRFRFANDPEMKRFWIEDTQRPQVRWQIDRGMQVLTNNYRDYAIVARFVDASTGKPAVVSAGIARGGTVAAGEFLSQASNMNAILSQAPPGWEGKNMEFVLSTEIIDGRSAPPKIEAMYFW